MAAYRRVYDSRHLQADCQEPGSAPEHYARQLNMGHLFNTRFLSPTRVSTQTASRSVCARFSRLCPTQTDRQTDRQTHYATSRRIYVAALLVVLAMRGTNKTRMPVIAASPSAEVKRYQNSISSISGRRSGTSTRRYQWTLNVHVGGKRLPYPMRNVGGVFISHP